MKSSQSKIQSAKKERIRKFPSKIPDPKLKKALFDHWQKTPVIKEIPEPMPLELIQQEVRSAILDVLREGVEEYYEKQDLVTIRHVFSAKELHRLIKEKISVKIKISNVYFHINKLKENGYVQIVTSIKEGRQITHFYGRTAKLFLWTEKPLKKEGITDDSVDPNFVALIQHFNPDMTVESINTLFGSFLKTELETHERVKRWMEKHVDVFTKLKVDTRDVYNFLKLLDRCGFETIDVYNSIIKLFNYPEG